MSKKEVLVLFAEGFEEVEAVTPVDYLRRAGFTVSAVSCAAGKTVTGSRGLPVVCGESAAEALARLPGGADAVVCPGGMPGAANLAASPEAARLIALTRERGGVTAALCAAPIVVFARLGLLTGKAYTCYPGFETQAEKWAGADAARLMAGSVFTGLPAVSDGALITGQAAGAAEEFSLALIRALAGDEDAATLRRKACLREPRR